MYILSIILFVFPQIMKKITKTKIHILRRHATTIDVQNIRSIITTEYINN